FRDIHLKSLNDYKGAQTALQKAVATNDLFVHSTSNGATVPALISNHLKLPTYQLVKSATGVDNDPRVVEARDLAANDLTTVAQSATTYLGTVYAVQVKVCKAMINPTNAAERFAEALQSYSGTIISGVGSTDLNRWTPCITMLKAAFLQELEDLNLEFCARQAKAAKAKETKATLVATARQDAEMIDAIKPVGELISE
ncbi:hypothetical protein DFH07DRAFT_714545, partial [Mycena maculata]